MKVLSQLKPENVFSFFEYLSSVPHGSGNTKQISDLCVSFAKERNLEYFQDDFNNVIIYKKASQGYEGKKPVILQGHLDMVYAVSTDCKKNTLTDPITLKTDGKFVFADKTSLGADDCISVAMALAILDDNSLKHPPLEVVLTTDEETGMTGAQNLDFTKLHSNIMLNMDSGAENSITCGCAGGLRITSKFNIKRDPLNEKCLSSTVFCRLFVDGCEGGHSGNEIDKESANANVLLFRALYQLSRRAGIRLCKVEGGRFENAIPKFSEAIIAVPKKAYEIVCSKVEEINVSFKSEYENTDKNLNVSIKPVDQAETPVCREDSVRIIGSVFALPNGVMFMNKDIKGLVETSLNFGILQSDDKSVTVHHMIRSSVKSKSEYVADIISSIVSLNGGSIYEGDGYPAWVFNKESPIRKQYVSSFKKLWGNEPVLEVTHAGLECGIFCGNIENFDCISIGPNAFDIHTVNERVSVESVGRVYAVVCDLLENL